MTPFNDLQLAIAYCRRVLINTGKLQNPLKWQGIEIKDKPGMKMWETLDVSFKVKMPQYERDAIHEIKPNLPWVNIHFEERVGRKPLNPGESYKSWPFAKEAEKSLDEHGKFSHTYMERYWPKYAGQLPTPKGFGTINQGIRYEYGDLQDVMKLLKKEPDTRQAFLPVWFPEDTGVVHGGRVPCTLGYLFVIRDGYLHITYYMRSCDFVRHFRDDIYLTWELANYVRNELYVNNHTNTKLSLGYMIMHIANLHCFENDLKLIGDEHNG